MRLIIQYTINIGLFVCNNIAAGSQDYLFISNGGGVRGGSVVGVFSVFGRKIQMLGLHSRKTVVGLRSVKYNRPRNWARVQSFRAVGKAP